MAGFPRVILGSVIRCTWSGFGDEKNAGISVKGSGLVGQSGQKRRRLIAAQSEKREVRAGRPSNSIRNRGNGENEESAKWASNAERASETAGWARTRQKEGESIRTSIEPTWKGVSSSEEKSGSVWWGWKRTDVWLCVLEMGKWGTREERRESREEDSPWRENISMYDRSWTRGRFRTFYENNKKEIERTFKK